MSKAPDVEEKMQCLNNWEAFRGFESQIQDVFWINFAFCENFEGFCMTIRILLGKISFLKNYKVLDGHKTTSPGGA